MIEYYYLVNKLNDKLTIKQGYVTIEAKGFVRITQHDASDPTILYAMGRDWAEIVSEEPKASVAADSVTAEVTEPYRGMTEDELKASRKDEVAQEPGITTALGVDSTVEVKPEPAHKAKKKAA
jgi:hypothetical protein